MPYAMDVALAEMQLRHDEVGRWLSSEADLVRVLRGLLPGWDIDVATTDRGESESEIVSSWGRPGLIVSHHPQVSSMSSLPHADALAAIATPYYMSERDRVFMFLYQDISRMNELVAIHEAAHALNFKAGDGHGERWLDTYLEMLDRAGLHEAVNLISHMTGKSGEPDFFEGSRKQLARMGGR